MTECIYTGLSLCQNKKQEESRMSKKNENVSNPQQSLTSVETMAKDRLCSREELRDYTCEIADTYRYWLYQKGYRKTRTSEITAKEVEETKRKYNLSDSILDLDFGILEGKYLLTIYVESFYGRQLDDAHITWLKNHISLHFDKLRCFILRCAVREPKLDKSQTYDFKQQFDLMLQSTNDLEINLRDETRDWYFTPYEFGQLCGFLSAAHWAIGGNWAFNENDYDLPIDWEHFYSYLEKRTIKLKKQDLQEISVIFQMIMGLNITNEADSEGRYMIRSQRRKSTEILSMIDAILSEACTCGNAKRSGELTCYECNIDLRSRGAICTVITQYGLAADKSYNFIKDINENGLGQTGKCVFCGMSYVMGGFPTSHNKPPIPGERFPHPPLVNEPRCCTICWGTKVIKIGAMSL
jgi:hypothetical protein